MNKMDEAGALESIERGVMTRLLASLDMTDFDRSEITLADAYLDEALDAVDDEEPTLLGWLSNDTDLERLCWANRSVMYWLVVRNSQRGVPLQRTINSIDKLVSRMLAATAWRATMRARELQ